MESGLDCRIQHIGHGFVGAVGREHADPCADYCFGVYRPGGWHSLGDLGRTQRQSGCRTAPDTGCHADYVPALHIYYPGSAVFWDSTWGHHHCHP